MDSNWFMLSCSQVCVAFRRRSLCQSERHTQRWVRHFKRNASHSRFAGTCCWVPRFIKPLSRLISFSRNLCSLITLQFLFSLHVLLLSMFSHSKVAFLVYEVVPSNFNQWWKTLNHSRKESNRWWVENWMITRWRISFVLIFQVGFILPLLNQTEASGHLEGHQSETLYLLASNIKVFTVDGLKHAELQKRPRKEGLANHWNICRSCFRCAKAFRWSVGRFDEPLFKFPFFAVSAEVDVKVFQFPTVDKLQTLVCG